MTMKSSGRNIFKANDIFCKSANCCMNRVTNFYLVYKTMGKNRICNTFKL